MAICDFLESNNIVRSILSGRKNDSDKQTHTFKENIVVKSIVSKIISLSRSPLWGRPRNDDDRNVIIIVNLYDTKRYNCDCVGRKISKATN